MGLAIVLALLGFAALGAPLFAVFGAAALILFGRMADTPLSGAANDMYSEKFADSPLLVTIPLFTLAGVLMAESGTPRRLVEVSKALLGWLPGGLGIVCLVASAIFTTFTGGSGITIVAIGALLLPALQQEKYPEKFSLGLVTSGGSLGLLFPPSLPIILYGVVAGVEIERLFLAGLLPGLVTLVALGLFGSVVAVKAGIQRTPFQPREALRALWIAKWEAALPVVLIAGMATGALRIHEAAAFTALYVLVVEVFVYRDIDFRKDIPRIIRESTTLVGAILIILAAAIGFTAYLIQANVPQAILESMQRLISSKYTFLFVLNLFLLVVGMLMDIFSAIVVVVPLIVPIATHFGINPLHLGIVFLLNLEIGYLTPPVGLNLFISSFRFNRPMSEVYRAVVMPIALLLVSLAITTYVPWLTTWHPSTREAGVTIDRDSSLPLNGGGAAEPSGGETLDGLGDDSGGATLDDLSGGGGETLDDLVGNGAAAPEAPTPADSGAPSAP
ncbi:MAG: TRAP transporter large permease subunit [Polyangiales bacterium]